MNTMKSKISNAAKWSDFKIMREKIIDDYIKAKRVQATAKAVQAQIVVKAVLQKL